MAEPLAVFGIAANVIQFLEFGGTLFSASQQIYRHGTIKDHIDIKLIAKDLHGIATGLRDPVHQVSGNQALSDDETSLYELATQCQSICDELCEVLEKLKVQAKNTKLGSFKAAMKIIWKKEQVQSLQKRMDGIRQELIIHILMSFRRMVNRAITPQYKTREVSDVTPTVDNRLGETFIKYLKEFKDLQLEACDRWRSELEMAVRRDGRSIEERGGSSKAYLADGGRKRKQEILDQLSFPEMTDRDDRIVDAYEKTFMWIFRDRSESWASFVSWLRDSDGSGLYWITGKPGSGKSTLMKYICKDPRTFTYLTTWASTSPSSRLVTAAFYFWNSGIQIQTTEQGLLRSLLFQILQQAPNLAPCLFPERWEIATFFETSRSHDWSLRELHTALSRVNTGERKLKYCLFVDGLDEFGGNHRDLVNLLSKISSSPYIKVCAASRPWNIFEDAFGFRPSLTLQSLTYRDIKQFVGGNFHRNVYFAELELQEPAVARQLIETIVTKAAGVFLWVHLVVKSLLDGLSNGDRVSDLQQRLEMLPPDLENLYRKILDSLDPFYLAHAYEYFQMVRSAAEPLTLLTFSLADEKPNYLFDCSTEPLTPRAQQYRAEIMRRRLNSRCKGLLEIATSDDPPNLVGLGKPSKALLIDVNGPSKAVSVNPNSPSKAVPIVLHGHPTAMIGSKVQYLHATVKDFFEKPKVWDGLDVPKESFDPHITLCRSYIIQFKITPSKTVNDLWDSTRKCLSQAYPYEPHSDGSRLQDYIRVLDEFDYIAQQKIPEHISGKRPRSQVKHWIHSFPHSREIKAMNPSYPYLGYDTTTPLKDLSFLTIAVNLDLYHYVAVKLDSISDNAQEDIVASLLLSALSDKYCLEKFFGMETFPSVRIVRLLLSKLTGPIGNLDSNVWHSILNTLIETDRTTLSPSLASRWLLVIVEFLNHGAKVSYPFEGVVATISRFADSDTRKQVKPIIDSHIIKGASKDELTKNTKK